MIISDKQYLTEFLSLREENPRLVHNKKHTLDLSGTKSHLVLSDDHPSTSLSVPVDHVRKHIALEMIRKTPEYLSQISAKKARKANEHLSKNIKKDSSHTETQISFRKKKPLSVEMKIANAAQNLKTPMAEAFKNAKAFKKKK